MKNLAMLAGIAVLAAATLPASARADVNVGDRMPKINATQLYNNEYEVDLDDLEGYVVVVEFWATWCGPCKRSIPHLNELHKEYKDKGVVFVGLSDESSDTVSGFMKNMKMEYLVGAGSTSGKTFGVRAIPHAFIVDPDGVVRWKGNPLADDFDSELKSAVANYKPVRRLGGGPEWNAALLDRIDDALRKRDYTGARSLLKRIDQTALEKDNLRTRYTRASTELSSMAEKDFDRAIADVNAGRFESALDTLRTIASDFAGLPLGKKAADKVAELESDPKVLAARRNSAAEALAANALKRAKDALSSGDKLRAYHRLNAIVSRYGGTAAANEATKLLDNLKKDEELMSEINGG